LILKSNLNLKKLHMFEVMYAKIVVDCRPNHTTHLVQCNSNYCKVQQSDYKLNVRFPLLETLSSIQTII
jgi:SH3-like domain-containing protein